MNYKPLQLENLKFDGRGLLPVVVQDASSNKLLMVAYANREAVERTLSEGFAHFYSRSREELWKKGATSGNVQRVVEVLVDCDADALLYRVEPAGPACHTGEQSCFFRHLERGTTQGAWGTPARSEANSSAGGLTDLKLLSELFEVIESRKRKPPQGSYVARLLGGHWDEALRKIGEEATEVMLAAVEPGHPSLVAEVADLWFHSLIVLARYDHTLDELLKELRSRRK